MSHAFLDIATTPSVRAARTARGAATLWDRGGAGRRFERLGEAEAAFIAARDSFYLASVSETGWPYVQHRGGPVGFLKRLDDATLGFAELPGNRQYISLGNTIANDRVALILMDYARRRRLKLYARIEHHTLADRPDLAARLMSPDDRRPADHACVLRLEAFDWNCPQHITPRFSQAEVAAAAAPLAARLEHLEAENATRRKALADKDPPQ